MQREQAAAMLDALKALGLHKSLRDQLRWALIGDPPGALRMMRQLIDAEPTVIRRLNAAGLALAEV